LRRYKKTDKAEKELGVGGGGGGGGGGGWLGRHRPSKDSEIPESHVTRSRRGSKEENIQENHATRSR